MYKHIIFALCFLMAVSLQAQPKKGSLLIKNGTVITITGGDLENTDVLIRDGKINRIGKNLRAPKGVETVDATGMYVMPGIIDAHSHAGLSAVNEGSNPITPEVSTEDAVEPTSISLYRALAGGVTASHAMHGSANAIGGQCETIKHRWGEMDPDNVRMEGAPRTIKFALGENPMRSHGERSGVNPSSRMGVEQVIRQAFAKAQQYKAAWKKYEANPEMDAPEYSLRLQTMADILDGKILIHCHSYRADEILMLMNVLKDFGVNNITYQHTNEGFKVAPELAEFGAHASVFADWWAYKFEVYYSTAYNAAILTKNGVVTSINSDSGELIRHLYHEAAKTQRYGNLTDNEALKLITINPAIQLGIDSRVGSIEKGKDGDIAIFKNHPLSIYAIPQKTIVDGVIRFDINKDADDMRLSVNPEEKVMPILYFERDRDACMEGSTMVNK
ncbi:MAG: amidohydrolase family protein [Bacteroidia bacterium]|nr:amidohydrolase family protein [Bacteroidia bacterium]